MSRPRKDTLETRKQLLDAAEALFAQRGIDNVGLIDISRAAGQKNRNATQYHFGDKDAVINAVLDRHTDQINRRREQMLLALRDRAAPTLAEVVEVFVRPVAEHVARTDNSLAFLLINSQLMTSVDAHTATDRRVADMPAVKEMSALFARLQPKVSPTVRRGQMLLIRSMLHHGLASFHARYPGRSNKAYTDTLCAGIEAVLRRDEK